MPIILISWTISPLSHHKRLVARPSYLFLWLILKGWTQLTREMDIQFKIQVVPSFAVCYICSLSRIISSLAKIGHRVFFYLCWFAQRGSKTHDMRRWSPLVSNQVKWIPTQKESVMRPWCFLYAIYYCCYYYESLGGAPYQCSSL